jgi:C4-type Zn-finger protein
MEFHKKAYLQSEGSICPYCSSKNITGHQFGYEGMNIWQSVICEECGKEWTDVYKLVDVEPLNL